MMAPVELQIGDKTRIVVTLLTIEQSNNSVESVGFLDVAHALSGRPLNDSENKQENRVVFDPPPGTKSESESQFSTVSIRDFLSIVNETHQGFLSYDVIKNLEVKRRGEKKGLFSEHDPLTEEITRLEQQIKKLEQGKDVTSALVTAQTGRVQIAKHLSVGNGVLAERIFSEEGLE